MSFSKISVCVCVCVCALKKILSFVSFWWVSSALSFRRTSCNLSCCKHPAAHTQQNKHLERFQPNTWISKKELNIPELFRQPIAPMDSVITPNRSANSAVLSFKLLLHHLLRHEASQKHFPRPLLQKIGPSHVHNSIQFSKIPSLDWLLPTICKVFRMMCPSRRSFAIPCFFYIIIA